ncbi:response regulator transcription factor [Nocardia goodfellowii]
MQEIIDSIATLSWPVLALVTLVVFKRPLTRVIASAERRQFTLRVGGQELDMQQLSEQQDDLIADLQAQLVQLRAEMVQLNGRSVPVRELEPARTTENPVPGGPTFGGPPPWMEPAGEVPAPDAGAVDTRRALAAVLWVDDNPANNALILDRLERSGIRVDSARTTQEGLHLLDRNHYGAILSDIGRKDDGRQAGLHLIEEVRRRGITLPVVIFTSRDAATRFREPALTAGANFVTSSAIELMEELTTLGLLRKD